MAQRINYDYFRIGKELPLLFRASFIKSQPSLKGGKGKILIINSCLIGDFIASLPALSQFIKKTKFKKIDLVVSHSVKPLAEKIKGINKVFTAKSIHAREIENTGKSNFEIGAYDTILIMRLSPDTYSLIKKIKAREIKTPLVPYLKFVFNLAKNIITRRGARQWKEANFQMLNLKAKDIKFEDIFNFSKPDYKKIKKLGIMKTTSKIIIIHTGSGWPMKLWNNDKWIDLIKRINSIGKFRFIFVGTKEEIAAFREISAKLNFRVYSLIGKMDLKDLMLVLRCSDYFIGVDSGPRNMAHLADLRSVSIMGPGPYLFKPWHKKDIAIEKSEGRWTSQFLFYSKNSFISKITSDEVFGGFKRLIKRN